MCNYQLFFQIIQSANPKKFHNILLTFNFDFFQNKYIQYFLFALSFISVNI